MRISPADGRAIAPPSAGARAPRPSWSADVPIVGPSWSAVMVGRRPSGRRELVATVRHRNTLGRRPQRIEIPAPLPIGGRTRGDRNTPTRGATPLPPPIGGGPSRPRSRGRPGFELHLCVISVRARPETTPKTAENPQSPQRLDVCQVATGRGISSSSGRGQAIFPASASTF